MTRMRTRGSTVRGHNNVDPKRAKGRSTVPGRQEEKIKDPLSIMATIVLYTSPNLSISNTQMTATIKEKFTLGEYANFTGQRMIRAAQKVGFFEEVENYEIKRRRGWRVTTGQLPKMRKLVDDFITDNPDLAKKHGIQYSYTFLRNDRRRSSTVLPATLNAPPADQKKPGVKRFCGATVHVNVTGNNNTASGGGANTVAPSRGIQQKDKVQRVRGSTTGAGLKMNNTDVVAPAPKKRQMSYRSGAVNARPPSPATSPIIHRILRPKRKISYASPSREPLRSIKRVKPEMVDDGYDAAEAEKTTVKRAKEANESQSIQRLRSPIAFSPILPIKKSSLRGITVKAEPVDEAYDAVQRGNVTENNSNSDEEIVAILPKLKKEESPFFIDVDNASELLDRNVTLSPRPIENTPQIKIQESMADFVPEKEEEDEDIVIIEEVPPVDPRQLQVVDITHNVSIDVQDIPLPEAPYVREERNQNEKAMPPAAVEDEEALGAGVEAEEREGEEGTELPKVIHAPTGETYTAIRKLGHGSFGTVQLVVENLTQRQFALKCGKREGCSDTMIRWENAFYEKILQEARPCRFLAAKYPLFDYTHRGTVYRCELMDAYKKDLYNLMFVDMVSFTPRQVLKTMQQVCAGLAFINELGFIHADVKPDNIMLSHFSTYTEGDKTFVTHIDVRIVDFNVVIDKEGETTPFYFTGQSVPYRAPEMALEMACDEKIDTWGTGIIGMQMLERDFYVVEDADCRDMNDMEQSAALLGEMERLFDRIPSYMKGDSRFREFRHVPHFPSTLSHRYRCRIDPYDIYDVLAAGGLTSNQLKTTLKRMLTVDVGRRPTPGWIATDIEAFFDYLS